MSGKSTRRAFLKRLAGASAALALAPAILRSASPNTKPIFAFIGTGVGGALAMNMLGDLGAGCVCYCDADRGRWGEPAKRWPNAKGYQDYREMLDKHGKEIDAVTVGTPDHHHYPATILAMKMGKHVYTQKPLTHTVWEARQLALAARKFKVATQMGIQGHANEGWRLLVEWIRSGMIGEVKEVHTWTNRPVWPQGQARPQGEDPVPANLNWDLWIGPAPLRPYKGNRTYHDYNWRGFWDFGTGSLGDMGCHAMDGLFWALDPGPPSSVRTVKTSGPCEDTFPANSILQWDFPAKGNRAAFVSFWYDGGNKPPRPPELEPDRKLPDTGNLFIGTKATIMVSGDSGETPRIIPQAKMKEIGLPPRLIERAAQGAQAHYEEFYLAVSGAKPISFPKANFAYAAPMTEAILLGNVALRFKQKLDWDGETLKVTNVPEANRYVQKEYRKGWEYAL